MTARVFPHLHKEMILGRPWLIEEDPNIQWKAKRVSVLRNQTIVNLPIVRGGHTESSLDQVNLCSAKELATVLRRGRSNNVFVAVIREAKEETVESGNVSAEVEKAFHENMPECIKAVLHEFQDVFPEDLPPGIPPVRMGHEFRVELEDDTPPVH